MDVQALHRLGGVATALSGQAHAVADQVHGAESVVWVSTRADQYRADLAAEATAVHAAGDELAAAAAALHRHGDDVQHRLDQIASVAGWFADRVADARSTLAQASDDVADSVTDGARVLVDAARDMPAAGSLAWDSFVGRFR
ncbi:MAG: hypothetical protein H7323_02740 [Frankiales bacterium]|nr:hypothetical protein [Frankiales bacterium]